MSNLYLIAEIGINHDGETSTAKKLIEAAALGKCSAVKFQYRNLDRIYKNQVKEIGDEIIEQEIFRNYLSPNTIVELVKYAKQIGLDSGISFFNIEDMEDFSSLRIFDYLKIPSPELMNSALIDKAIKASQKVFISLGMHNEDEIEIALSKIADAPNVEIMHCISNYPVALHNSNLGYLDYLKSKWNFNVGYSSHDFYWENCLLALQKNITSIERHITLDKNARGLDHSTSSTWDEFFKIREFAENMHLIELGNFKRKTNQGEKLNRQNLGRSFFAKKNLSKGMKITEQDFEYRSPQIGLDYLEFKKNLNQILIKDLKEEEVLTQEHLNTSHNELTQDARQYANANSIAVPIRTKDYFQLSNLLRLENYEFHFSYNEVLHSLDGIEINPNYNYSIHLPDYINSNELFNPISVNPEIRKQSLLILEKTINFSKKIFDSTKNTVPIISSISGVNHYSNHKKFYSEIKELFEKFDSEKSFMTLQWLPPYAWYFGGSVKLPYVNKMMDMEFISNFDISITMDIAHLLMCENAGLVDANQVIAKLKPNIKHIHLADVAGIDGEGVQFGQGDLNNMQLINELIDFPTMKTIEVWQGHLNGGKGFIEALEILSKY